MSTDGWRVEQVSLQRSLSGPPVTRLRVTWRGFWKADCATVNEVAGLLDLATLSPSD